MSCVISHLLFILICGGFAGGGDLSPVMCPNSRFMVCSSTEWRYISDDDRERLSHRSEDGEFW